MKHYPHNIPTPLLQKWVAELRSGSHTQTVCRLKLHPIGSHCCLGVFVEHVLNLFLGETEYPDYEGYGYDALSPYMPRQLQGKFQELNDCERKTFLEIADWIEQNLKAQEHETPAPAGALYCGSCEPTFGWICTLTKDHAGPHVAHDNDDNLCARWNTEEGNPQ